MPAANPGRPPTLSLDALAVSAIGSAAAWEVRAGAAQAGAGPDIADPDADVRAYAKKVEDTERAVVSP